MSKFYKNGLTVNELAKLCSSAIENGYGDAVIQVQADADGISDIMVNGIEGWGNEFNEDGPKVLSLVSVTDKQQFERIYGSES